MHDPEPLPTTAPTVAIVGGGLAGLAAAVRLGEQGLRVELFESRSVLGGRAASYRDPASGELIDHCQHVGLACCTNFRDFCQRTRIADEFEHYDTLRFLGPDGRRSDLRASWWLPAPLHLLPSLLQQRYLPWRDRWQIVRHMQALARTPKRDADNSPTIGQWLRERHASPAAIERFWSVVLVSALGESLDRASLAAARKVFLDGFLAHRAGYALQVPRCSLRELFDGQAAGSLADCGVLVHRKRPLRRLVADENGALSLQFADGQSRSFDFVILAVAWRHIAPLLAPDIAAALPELAGIPQFSASPISGVHLWFDRALTELPHAVIVGRLAQWVFRRASENQQHMSGHYYQVVISASRDLASLEPSEIVATVCADLAAVFPAASAARLLASKIVTEREAVFSYRPGLDHVRPQQATTLPNLFVAGDWTNTGWPSTLEGAVRSGYLAAERVLTRLGRPAKLLMPDLPRNWLVRRLIGDS